MTEKREAPVSDGADEIRHMADLTRDWRRRATNSSGRDEVFWRAQRARIRQRLMADQERAWGGARWLGAPVFRAVVVSGALGIVAVVGFVAVERPMGPVSITPDPLSNNPTPSTDELKALFSDIGRTLDRPAPAALRPAEPIHGALDRAFDRGELDSRSIWPTTVTLNPEEEL